MSTLTDGFSHAYICAVTGGSSLVLINADFSRSACLTPDHYHWVSSPQAGVQRVMLDRIGDEVARATSIVRYAPGSSFLPHIHSAGEEILVLEGTFSDESGHYPAGWYLRNPPGSRHQPFSTEGCLLFVKLGQMRARETGTVRRDTRDPMAWQRAGQGEVCPLFHQGDEQVCVRRLPPGEHLREYLHDGGVQGVEVLVLEGEAMHGSAHYPPGTWLRFPTDEEATVLAGGAGLTCYLKQGHLASD